MRKGLLILALGLATAAGTAAAQDLAVPDAPSGQTAQPDAPAVPVTLPAKGITMAAVKKQFGEPRDKRGPVGGDTPKHPPITRWDYDAFVVIFEKDRVIDAVVPGAPPKLRSTAGLTRATDAPPPPAMPQPDQPPPPDQPMETPAETAPAAEAIVPEQPAAETPPPMEPTAEAAPVIPEAPAEAPPAEAAPAEAPPAEPTPPPAAAPAEPAQPYSDEAPPTPK